MIDCYYAMPTTHYNSPELKYELEFLSKLEYNPYVPSSEEDQKGYEQHGMDYFKSLIEEKGFKAVLFRSFHRGSIGKGVAYEAIVGLNMGLPVLEVVERSYQSPLLTFAPVGRDEITARELTVAQTRERIKMIRESDNQLDGLGRCRWISKLSTQDSREEEAKEAEIKAEQELTKVDAPETDELSEEEMQV